MKKQLIWRLAVMAVMAMLVFTACGNNEANTTGSADNASETEQKQEQDVSGEDTQYKKTVTVSNIRELANAIDSDTLIILKDGEYNFSELDSDVPDNPNVRIESLYGEENEYIIYGVKNLCIEAEKGAKAEIVTENVRSKPFSFQYCAGIILKGLTCGHKIEPGYCSGSVIYVERSSDVTLKNCRLYGCGTYGLEASQSENINLLGTEIYECNSGAVTVFDTDGVSFKGCSIHDNVSDNCLLWFASSYDITFEDTKIFNNSNSSTILSIAMVWSEYDIVSFKNCIFCGNDSEPDPELLRGIASFENCTISDTSIEHMGYARYDAADSGENEIFLDIKEVVMVGSDDADLMDWYGLTEEDMANDYAIVEKNTEYIRFRAYRDKTRFDVLGYKGDSNADGMIALMKDQEGTGGLLVSYVIENTPDESVPVLASISEVYVP